MLFEEFVQFSKPYKISRFAHETFITDRSESKQHESLRWWSLMMIIQLCPQQILICLLCLINSTKASNNILLKTEICYNNEQKNNKFKPFPSLISCILTELDPPTLRHLAAAPKRCPRANSGCCCHLSVTWIALSRSSSPAWLGGCYVTYIYVCESCLFCLFVFITYVGVCVCGLFIYVLG